MSMAIKNSIGDGNSNCRYNKVEKNEEEGKASTFLSSSVSVGSPLVKGNVAMLKGSFSKLFMNQMIDLPEGSRACTLK